MLHEFAQTETFVDWFRGALLVLMVLFVVTAFAARGYSLCIKETGDAAKCRETRSLYDYYVKDRDARHAADDLAEKARADVAAKEKIKP